MDVAPGLWVWRLQHPAWSPEARLGAARHLDVRRVGRRGRRWSTRSRPPEDAAEVWARLDARAADGRRDPQARPHPRRRPLRRAATAPARSGRGSSGATTFPRPSSRRSSPGRELPGGLVALYDGRGRNETPLWLPEQRALVFADALTAPGGELRVWDTPWHEERTLPALRALLELPFEHVIVAHGEPVHTAPTSSARSSSPAFGP